jgi:hypothetical protein
MFYKAHQCRGLNKGGAGGAIPYLAKKTTYLCAGPWSVAGPINPIKGINNSTQVLFMYV